MVRFTLLGLVSSALIVTGIGCGGGGADYKKTSELKKAPAVEHVHDHGAKGPHGGSLVELGEEEYHAEVVLDHDAHALRVYVLGKDAKTATPITSTELTITPEGKPALTLKATPQKDDGEGKSSVFEVIDNEAVHAFMDAGMIHADLRVKIGDKPFTGHVDYHLDEGNGIEAINGLRRRLGEDLPAILITADRSPKVREEARTEGIQILNKPIKPAALRALLAQWRVQRIAAAE